MNFTDEQLNQMSAQQICDQLRERAHAVYHQKETALGEPLMRELERVMFLRVVDEYWMDHIDAMDDLKQGIRLQAYGQEDPVKAYKREGADMFEQMNMSIQHEAVRRIYLARVQTNTVERKAVAKVTGESAGGDPKEKPRRAPVRKAKKIGPNDPCPCGSGLKYKKCHGRNRGME
jgi:preprotein translocase subunit SecA